MAVEPRKPRILQVIDNTDPGGAQTQLATILAGLRDQYDLSVAVLGRSGRAEERYRSLGIPIHSLQTGGNRWDPGVFQPLLQLIRREEPDLVHAHLFKSMVMSTLAARMAGVPCLLHDHSGLDAETMRFYFPGILTHSLYSWVYRMAVRSCAGLLVLTPHIQSSYLKEYHLPADRITVLPNAIDLNGFKTTAASEFSLRKELDLPEETRLVVMVGRMAEEKDWPTFIDIASRFQHRSQLAFIAIGSGSLENQIRRSVAEKGLSNFHFAGDIQDVPSILCQADVFILTSIREAFGIVLLEAMAAGLPVISTRTGGPSSIIQPEVNGLLVEPGDVDSFVTALERVLTDTGLADRLVQNAKRSLTQYDSQVVCLKLSNLYNKVIQTRRIRSHD